MTFEIVMQLAFCGHKHAALHAVPAAALVAKTAPDVSLNLLGPNRIIVSFCKRQSAKAERKARAHRLIRQGVLFDLAGLAHRGRGELLGLLLAAAKTEDPGRWAHWKEVGEALWPKRAMPFKA